MTLQAVNSLRGLPDDALIQIFRYADGKTELATIQVCRRWRALWQTDPDLIQQRAKTVHKTLLGRVHDQMIERRYPSEWVEIFRQNNRPISKLPVLDLESTAVNDYINFLDVPDMGDASIVRFIDGRNRPGIALCLEYTRAHFTRQERHLIEEMAQTDPEGARSITLEPERAVLALFKRYEDQPQSRWTYAALNNAVISEISNPHYRALNTSPSMHAPCPDCPFPGASRVNPKLIRQLLSNQIPRMRICSPQTVTLAEPPNY